MKLRPRSEDLDTALAGCHDRLRNDRIGTVSRRGGDDLDGQAGGDGLGGQTGADTLIGGLGMDVVNGGAGVDTCRGEALANC